MEELSIKKEYDVFYAYTFKQWTDNTPMVELHVNDSINTASVVMTVTEVDELIELLNKAKAKSIAMADRDPNDRFGLNDSTPF